MVPQYFRSAVQTIPHVISLSPLLRRVASVAGVAGLMVAATPLAVPFLVSANAQDDSAARQAIITHPNIARLRADICQLYAQADIARSGKYPQVDLRVVGGTSLTSKIKSEETRRRRFDDREIDAVIGLRQNVYDWGLTDRSVRIAETNRMVARIDLVLETDRQASDLLVLMIRYHELAGQEALYQTLRAELSAIADQIEEGVNVGALTLTDLRDIKINNLDIEVAHLQVMREMSILQDDIAKRFQLTIDQATPFLVRYLDARPSVLPTVIAEKTSEIRKLDLQQRVTNYELDRLKALRRPALNAIVDTTLFDVDGYSEEYEVVGRFEVSMPLYDGGSNRANRREVQWQSRSITNERSGLIRTYNAQLGQISQSLSQLEQNIVSNAEKTATTRAQLESHLAQEGQTLSEPLAKARLMSELNQLERDQIGLESERERELMRGLFFADEISNIMNLSDEVTTC